MSMSYWKITNPASGTVLGVYPGATKRDALEALAQNAGFATFAEACDASGDDVDDDAGLTVERVADVGTVPS
jgi:hypothetical protein